MRILRLGGFVESVRGTEGGYSLARPANSILVSNILTTLGGKLYEPDFCEKYPGVEDSCMHTSSCSIKPLWSKLQSAIDNALNEMTLEDLYNNSTLRITPSRPSSADTPSGATFTPSRMIILNK